ncbi:MAG: HlyD family secretion protein [Gammaproteobacteria bacterium]|nr:HlyD family secretion protein [Gammaproteobacteria bacterium]
MKNYLQRFPMFFIAVGLAVIIAVVLVKSKTPLPHTPSRLPEKPVDVIHAQTIPFRIHFTGYGNVEPANVLHSIAQLSGTISYVHHKLKSGETIEAGTTVVRIDAEDYTLTLKQTEADLQYSRSSLNELNEEEKTTQRSLVLAKKNLQFGEAEYSRIKSVYSQKLVSKSALDAEEQRVISLRQQVEELQGKMNGFKSRRQSVIAQIVRAEQEVKNRETILGRTEIVLPFTARIGTVNIDQGEFVSTGSMLFEAIDLKSVEIKAQLPTDSMRDLVSHLASTPADFEQLIRPGGNINDSLKLSASVRLVSNMPGAIWEANVLRISESIDVTRQTLGIVVGVDDPYKKIIPGRRPPLLKGMFTAIDLYAPPRPAMVIPRKSLHQGRVYIAGADDRLEIRSVETQLIQGDMVLIRKGIEEGVRIIITDLFPVIEGMPLQINVASDYQQLMKKNAAGDR